MNKYINALAKINHGFDLYNKNDKQQACLIWESINRADNAEAYSQAQFNLGCVYQDVNPNKAYEYWKNVVRFASEQGMLDKAALDLGIISYKKGDKQLARKYWQDVSCEDNEVYLDAQFNLGYSYQEENIEKTKEYWDKITLTDSPDTYAKIMTCWGYYYIKKKGDKLQAQKYWEVIKQEHNKKAYSQAQFNLGFLYRNDEKDKAKDCWSKVDSMDCPMSYAMAQFYLGYYYFQEKKNDKSYECWKNIENFSYLFNREEVMSSNQLLIYSMQKLVRFLKANTTENNLISKIDLPEKLDSLQDCVMIILKELYVSSEERFAHYTSADVAEVIIQKGSFHLGISNYMNDPLEGKILLKECKIPFDYDNSLLAFTTSFTLNENSLNQFRLYGKTKDVDGSGVSLVLHAAFFNSVFDASDIPMIKRYAFNEKLKSYMINIGKQSENDNFLKNSVSKKLLYKLPVFRCIYLNPESDYINIAHRNKRSFYSGDIIKNNKDLWDDYISRIESKTKLVKEALDKIKDTIDEIKLSIEQGGILQQQEVYEAISTTLLPIIYLTKHAAFEEEAECRILYVTSILDDVIQKDGDRVYVEYGIDLADQYQQDRHSQNYLERIYLGPKADPRAELNLKKSWIDKMRAKEMANNEIKIPTIIKSDMPLA